MWNGHGWGMGGDFGMGFGMIFSVLLWAVVIVGIVLLVRWLSASTSQQHPAVPQETPLDVLRKRYARGEIGKEEFEEKKRDLQQ